MLPHCPPSLLPRWVSGDWPGFRAQCCPSAVDTAVSCHSYGPVRSGVVPWVPAPPSRLCLKGRAANGAVPERLRSGHRGCDSGWGGGGYWRLEMRLGAGVGVRECLWGRVKAGSVAGSAPPPPSLQAIPCPPPSPPTPIQESPGESYNTGLAVGPSAMGVHVNLRTAFIRRVYGILTLQLLLTVAVCAFCALCEPMTKAVLGMPRRRLRPGRVRSGTAGCCRVLVASCHCRRAHGPSTHCCSRRVFALQNGSLAGHGVLPDMCVYVCCAMRHKTSSLRSRVLPWGVDVGSLAI